MQNYRLSLEAIGLSEKEALLYEALLGGGKMGIGRLAHKVPKVKRGSMYAVLYGLVEKGLVVEVEDAGKKVFQVESPEALATFAEKRERRYKEAKNNLDHVMPQLRSDYNLLLGRPNIRFFEGERGFADVLQDTLTSKTEICTYVDHDAVLHYFPAENERYVRERIARGIKKRIIALDCPSMRRDVVHMQTTLTEVRVVKKGNFAFTSAMQIYDGKVSYQCSESETLIAVLVQSPNIFAMHRALFETLWATAAPLRTGVQE